MCASSSKGLSDGSVPLRYATRLPSWGRSAGPTIFMSLSANPAAPSRAAIASAAFVQEPTDSVVLISTSSLYSARNSASPARAVFEAAVWRLSRMSAACAPNETARQARATNLMRMDFLSGCGQHFLFFDLCRIELDAEPGFVRQLHEAV